MKNKKGFTLIELLAVIVVLAIIALIATPIVMNTIKNAKKGAAERTADNYIKQVETAVAESRIDGTKITNGTYNIQSDGNLCPVAGCGENDKDKITIDMSGNKPTSGTVKISNGGVSQDGTKLVVGDYNVKYKDDKLTASEPYKGVLCKANTTKVKALLYSSGDPSQASSYTSEEVGLLASEATSKYDIGVTYTCELGDGEKNTFYVLETSGDNVSLIAGFNLGGTVAWVTKKDYLAAGGTESGWRNINYGNIENNNLGPVTANKILKERTSNWTKLDENQITLPSGQQIATAGGDTKWTENYYTKITLPTWLYSQTKSVIGAPGYYTSTLCNSSSSAGRNFIWSVGFGGFPGNSGGKLYTDSFGDYKAIRPVITVSKSNLS